MLTTLRVHEPFRDEAQTWLIGRDTSLGEMFSLLRYQGHPALWYLMVRPLARLGLPYGSMSLLHGLLAIGSAFLVLRYAPFTRLTRALLVFSFWMFWMYAIESRVYAVGVLLLFLIAWRYPRRHVRPCVHAALITLLFNSNLHMAFIAGGLTLAFAWEVFRARAWDRRHVLALCIMAAGVFALLWQFNFLRAPADNMHGGRFLWLNPPAEIARGVTEAFFLDVKPYQMLAASALAALLLMFYPLLIRPIPLLVMALHVTGQCLMFWLITSALRFGGILLLGGVFAWWIAHDHPEATGWPDLRVPGFAQRLSVATCVLNLCLVSSVHMGWFLHSRDRAFDYSGARRMAEYIRREGLARYPIAANRYAHLSSIAPYFPGKRFWYIGIGQWVTYVRQDAEHWRAHALSNGEALRLLSEQMPAGEPFLLLTDRPLEGVPPGFRPLYKVDETVRGSEEFYYLYFRDGVGALQ